MAEETEKSNDIVCPHCAVENPRNRLTCQVCGERLSPGSTKLHDSPSAESKKKKPKKAKDAEKQTVLLFGENSTRSLVANYPKEETTGSPNHSIDVPAPPSPKVKRKRTKRHVTSKSPDPVFFILEGSKLKPVKINWGVIKPLRRKDISQQARNVLSLYNRSKDLLK